MAFSKQDALECAREIIAGPRTAEAERLERIREALAPTPPPGKAYVSRVNLPESAPAHMKELARKSETNYLPLLVDTFGQVMKVDGYESLSDADAPTPWARWQVNRMDSRQTGLIRGALSYGTSYALVLPGQGAPVVKCFSPRQMTAVVQSSDDEWPMFALYVDGDHVYLVDEEWIYDFGIEKWGKPRFLPAPSASLPLLTGGLLTYIGQWRHGAQGVPVVRFRDRMLLDGEEQLGIVEPLMNIQERIDETQFQADVAAYYQAFKIRYVIGWVPADEREEMKANASQTFYVDMPPGDVRIDSLDQGDPSYFQAMLATAKRDFAAIGQLPAQSLGIDGISNISDATLAGLESAKSRKSSEIMTSFGESYEQLFRLMAHLDGNASAAEDYDAEVRWRNFEARSFAQVVDGLGKLVQMLGLDPAIALEDVPGMSGQKLERAIEAMRRQKGSNLIDALAKAGPADVGAVSA